ncbi:DUF2807 domain-containing protein [Rufibacter hautae]|uniref:Uncharacterized protein n=1 Tax=Rufibacter hautae TaxID=2595005 RepID=A0A5B6TBF2_9BACT|nr:DUF2807 domain-containing protein [Rufibacter hautae]KAA3437809.1 hypothetical protein FOA19_10980 [Rufibacter hautae]
MKKSTILIFSALVFFLCSLTAFNFAMKAEYDKGLFRDPLVDFISTDITGFDAIQVNGGSKLSVKIVQGASQVRVHERAQDFVRFKKQGNKLIVDVDQIKGRDFRYNGSYSVYISCPKLTSLTTSARYKMGGEPQTDLFLQEIYHNITLNNFTQDSLTIQQDHATAVELNNLKLGKLKAVVGLSEGSGSRLTILGKNQIQAADLSIQHKGGLNLFDVAIPSLTYQFSDSARAVFSGAALPALSKK